MGDTDLIPVPPRLIDMRTQIPHDHQAHHEIERAIAAAWSLAVTTRPSPGSIRARTATPGKARLVRANGERWTLIGRTDGPVLLLTDKLPGVPVDVNDAARISELLNALTAASERSHR